MGRRKIASFTPMWNQELWIKPHFDMLSKLDFNLVAMHKEPLPSYRREHGYSIKADGSEELLKKYFPKVKIVESDYPPSMDFRAELYNEGLEQLQDYDIVFRLDPDMFWTEENWKKMLEYIDSTDFDAYRMDFHPDSINYYMTGDFNHGLKDAWEHDILAVNPKKLFQVEEHETYREVLGWPFENDTYFNWEGFMCHHFRGWNKPKSTPNPEWLEYETTLKAFEDYGNWKDGIARWFKCPQEIREPIEQWMKVLEERKKK